jgi:hypothetical protein
MFISIIFIFINTCSHIYNLDPRLSLKACDIIKKHFDSLPIKNIAIQKSDLPFLSSFFCLKHKPDSFYIFANCYEPICLIELSNNLKVCVSSGLIFDSEFYNLEIINNLPKIKSAFFDKKLGFLATLPEFCFEKYKIELESQEEIFFKNKHLKIISSIEKSFTLDLEEKINQLIVHKKIPNSATLDVRFADQIILKGREGHG